MLGHRPLPGAADASAAGAAADADDEPGPADGGGGWAEAGLAGGVVAVLERLAEEGKVARRELDATTLAKLAEFSEKDGVEILERFGEADILPQVPPPPPERSRGGVGVCMEVCVDAHVCV
jgi:hypothetical protein